MSSSKSNPPTELPPRPAPSNASPNSDKNQSKYEAAVLLRVAKTQGWSEEKLTMALSDNPAKVQPPADTPSAAPAQVESDGQSKDNESEQKMKMALKRRAEAELKKRQETLRTIHQAEMEGWNDEKLVDTLRDRLEIRQELRGNAKSL